MSFNFLFTDTGTVSPDHVADVYTISPREAIVLWKTLSKMTYITAVSGKILANYPSPESI